MFYTGNCFQKSNDSWRQLEEWEFLHARQEESIYDTLPIYSTIIIALLGLVLNVLSIVIFLKLYCSSNTKNNIHIFFVYLSVSEIMFTISTSIVFMFIAITNSALYRWDGSAQSSKGGNATSIFFHGSAFFYNSGKYSSILLHALGDISNDLTIISQFSRNVWVAITALLRCYVATRRVHMQINQLYSVRRITFMYFAKMFVATTFYIVYKSLKFDDTIPIKKVHSCNISSWQTDGTLVLLRMVNPNSRSKKVIYDFIWTGLTQVVPLILIFLSSTLLIISLHNNTMANSSERNRKITRLVFIFAMTFALLEGPRGIWYILSASGLRKKISVSVSRRIANVTFILTLIDSVVNVFIYFFNDPLFKKELCSAIGRQRRHFFLNRDHTSNCAQNRLGEQTELLAMSDMSKRKSNSVDDDKSTSRISHDQNS